MPLTAALRSDPTLLISAVPTDGLTSGEDSLELTITVAPPPFLGPIIMTATTTATVNITMATTAAMMKNEVSFLLFHLSFCALQHLLHKERFPAA